jgi:hypothetical protein|tara:strand:- start:432 stop:587 length:156 start_codon:yes stop_codon:yes gene_type:complete
MCDVFQKQAAFGQHHVDVVQKLLAFGNVVQKLLAFGQHHTFRAIGVPVNAL